MMLSVSITHDFGSFQLDAAFDAPAGVTALFGRSGAGKTSIVNAVAGLMRPARGQISVDGRVLVDTTRGVFVPPHQRRIGYVFQEGRLFPHLTVLQNITYGRWFAGKAGSPGDLDDIVALLDIGSLMGRRPGGLSGGEKQRVALARAILSRPGFLLMDEPLAALDDARKSEILPYLERLRDETRLPILYVSHSVAEVARLATTVVLIEAGRVTAQGPAAVVLSDPAASAALGRQDTGAILTARVQAHEADGLSRLACGAGDLWVSRIDAAVGTTLRVRILAQDVMIARMRPTAISALNVLPCRVQSVTASSGPDVLVQLAIGSDMLLARVTQRSATALDLVAEAQVFAIIKAVTVTRDRIGAGIV